MSRDDNHARSPDPDPGSLWRAWSVAAATSAIDQSIRDLYDDLDQQIRARGPTCWTSGKCCNFDAYGHRLYVTGLEIAWMAQRLNTVSPAAHNALASRAVDPHGSCPFQIEKLCGVHAIRPLGCRIFFCQQGTQDWQQDLYEQFLTRLRVMHDANDLPYRYMEWRAGLNDWRTFTPAEECR